MIYPGSILVRLSYLYKIDGITERSISSSLTLFLAIYQNDTNRDIVSYLSIYFGTGLNERKYVKFYDFSLGEWGNDIGVGLFNHVIN